jgi:hypothetical protein
MCESCTRIFCYERLDHSPPEAAAAISNMFRVLELILARRGVDMAAAARIWADSYLHDLAQNGAALEVEQLLRAGCLKLPLAVTLKAGILLTRFTEIHSTTLGNPGELDQMVRQFESIALLFDRIWSDLSFDGPPTWPAIPDVPSPQEMAKYLRHYQYINIVPMLFAAMNIQSTRDIERHLPTAYVKAATSDWHDREVSALISAATGTNLDEGAHRPWRNRKFSKIALYPEILWHLAEILRLLGMSQLAPPTNCCEPFRCRKRSL